MSAYKLFLTKWRIYKAKHKSINLRLIQARLKQAVSSALLRAESCTQTLSSTVESGDFPAVLWSYEVWSSGDWGPPHNGGKLEFWFIMFADNIIISNAVTGWMGWWWIVSWPLISSHASSARSRQTRNHNHLSVTSGNISGGKKNILTRVLRL